MPSSSSDLTPIPLPTSTSGIHIQTGNRMDMMPPEPNDDPRIQCWLETWYGFAGHPQIKHIRIPVCDIDSLISALINFKERSHVTTNH